jgi:hypothetical protein
MAIVAICRSLQLRDRTARWTIPRRLLRRPSPVRAENHPVTITDRRIHHPGPGVHHERSRCSRCTDPGVHVRPARARGARWHRMPPIASNAPGNVNHDQGVDTPCSGRCRGFHCRHDARARTLVRSLIAICEPGPPSSAYAGPYRGRQTGLPSNSGCRSPRPRRAPSGRSSQSP